MTGMQTPFEIEFEAAGKRIVLRASTAADARLLYEEFARDPEPARGRQNPPPDAVGRLLSTDREGIDAGWDRFCASLQAENYAKPLTMLAAIKLGGMVTTPELMKILDVTPGAIGSYSRVIGNLAHEAGIPKESILQITTFPPKTKRPAEYRPASLLMARELPRPK